MGVGYTKHDYARSEQFYFIFSDKSTSTLKTETPSEEFEQVLIPEGSAISQVCI